jgi:hypothetical protein
VKVLPIPNLRAPPAALIPAFRAPQALSTAPATPAHSLVPCITENFLSALPCVLPRRHLPSRPRHRASPTRRHKQCWVVHFSPRGLADSPRKPSTGDTNKPTRLPMHSCLRCVGLDNSRRTSTSGHACHGPT